MFSFFIAVIIYLSRGIKKEEQENLSKTHSGKCEESSEDVSIKPAAGEMVGAMQNTKAKSIVEKKIRKFLIICLIGWIAAFGISILSIFIAGGLAINGKIEAGRFFLGMHGEYTEVSIIGYILSTANTFVVGVLFPFAAYALCSMGWKTDDPQISNKKFGIFFVVFVSFIGIFLAIKSFDCCVSAIVTIMRN
jgi:hypothetical protein